MKLIQQVIWFTALLLFIQTNANTIHLSQINNYHFLEVSEYQVLEDQQEKLTIDNIKEIPDSQWIQLNYFKHIPSTYWIKYTIYNDSETEPKWVLELLDPHIDQLTFYNEGGDIIHLQGFKEPFNRRVYLHKNQIFDLNIPKGTTRHFYLKIQSNSHIAFTAKIQSNSFFSKYSLSEYFLLGIFYGFLLIMILYNLILYFFTGMRTRIYYTLYVMSAALNSFTEDGIGFQYLWPKHPEINQLLADYEPLIYLGCYAIYAISFLDIGHYVSRFKTRLLLVISTFFITYIIIKSFSTIPDFWLLFYIIPFLMILFYSVNEYRNNKRNRRFLIIGTSLIIVSFFILFLRMQGLIENAIYIVYFFNFAVTIEILMFSMAMGDKLRFKQEEHLKDKELIIEGLKHNEELKDKVNRELETKVRERTQDLNEAKTLLEEQAKEITAMNLKLDLSNRDLSKKVVEVSKKRIHGTELNPEEFQEMYPDKLHCFQLLEEIKWKDGFNCRKCNNETYTQGVSFRSRRCTRCGTTETPTANTLFHGLRIPIEKAFYIFALVIHSKGQISSSDLEKKTTVGQKACWSFKQKIVDQLEKNKSKDNSWNTLIFNKR